MPLPTGGSRGDIPAAGPYIGGLPWNVKNSIGGKPLPGPALTGPRQGPQTAFPIGQPRPNVLQPNSVRPTGPSAGFDPSYLQNLATAIGGLFSRPQGNLSFNPLGNLSDISSPSLGFGNAPLPGLPSTMLQDAINGLAFMFNQPSAATGRSPVAGGNNSNRNNTGRGGYPLA